MWYFKQSNLYSLKNCHVFILDKFSTTLKKEGFFFKNYVFKDNICENNIRTTGIVERVILK